ncbi:MAG: succinate dehydrogenase cytochrome b subunit [Bacteroidales bacterium]|nr:succinate dehydrogenase cytochrome b subunit [Candidatus Cryptobacteroides caccocaballi]
MFIFNSSIGKKFIQAISGAFLIIFLLLHATINFFSVIDSFTGKYGVAMADEKLFSAGDGLFKLGCDFMSTPVISIMVPVLALGFLVHIIYGIWLTVTNIKARGGYKRYEVASKAKTDSWSSKNMCVLGVVILGFIAFHLTHFWAKMQLPEMFGIGEAENNPYLLLNATFGQWWCALLYIVWFVALWFHLNHGFWSMLQTVGFNNSIWFKRLKVLSVIVSSVIVLMFVSVAVNALIQAC